MYGRSTVNFLAEILFACTAKIASSVSDGHGGIPAAGHTVGPHGAPTPRNDSWHASFLRGGDKHVW